MNKERKSGIAGNGYANRGVSYYIQFDGSFARQRETLERLRGILA